VLSVILGAAQTIRAELAPGQPPCAGLEQIGRAAESGIRRAEQLLASSRGQEIGQVPDRTGLCSAPLGG
jgi:hypothetical protein